MSDVTEEQRREVWRYDAIVEAATKKARQEAADRIEELEGVLADIMQYDLRGILPPDILQRMEDMKVVI